MSKAPIRVAITGAAGQIGYSLLFRIASGAAFTPLQLTRVGPCQTPRLASIRSITLLSLNLCLLFASPIRPFSLGNAFPLCYCLPVL